MSTTKVSLDGKQLSLGRRVVKVLMVEFCSDGIIVTVKTSIILMLVIVSFFDRDVFVVVVVVAMIIVFDVSVQEGGDMMATGWIST